MRKGILFLEQFLGSDREAVLESVTHVSFVVSKVRYKLPGFMR